MKGIVLEYLTRPDDYWAYRTSVVEIYHEADMFIGDVMSRYLVRVISHGLMNRKGFNWDIQYNATQRYHEAPFTG